MEEQMARRLVAEEGKKLQQAGLVARTWGNISCRIDENHFVITPSGLDYETMMARDLVLMDIQMPEMNGYDTARAIRGLAREDAGTIPIIAMTANAFAEDVQDALDAGMDAHVAKPIDMASLSKVLGEVFSS